MNRNTWLLTAAVTLGLAGVAAAQSAPKAPPAAGKTCDCPMHGDGPHGGMHGGPMMDHPRGPMPPPPPPPMLGPPMLSPDVKVEVAKTAKGVTITLTSEDARSVSRIQKMAEIMRLTHELQKDLPPPPERPAP